jgi:hypothetical protein
MVIAKEKSLDDIGSMISSYRKIMIIGCAGCTAVCLAGGQQEVLRLKDEISLLLKKGGISTEIKCYTVERQCDPVFLPELRQRVARFDAILSMGCGAGTQLLAEVFDMIPVFPALDTAFIGINRSIGLYEENCRSCGDCQLGYTGGICPVTRCAKSIFNGPCGGSLQGKCEVDHSRPCAWCVIYDRLKKQNRIESILNIRPPMQWKNQNPEVVVQKGFEKLHVVSDKN